jgi:hypothetical protein
MKLFNDNTAEELDDGEEKEAGVPESAEVAKGQRDTLKAGAAKTGLNMRLKTLHGFLSSQKENYAMSTEQTVGQFLQRMLRRNPGMIAMQYMDKILAFDGGTTRGELESFKEEVAFFITQAPRLKHALGMGKGFPGTTLNAIRSFVKSMRSVEGAVDALLELDDDDRKEVLSGKKEELSRGQKAVISKRRGLIRSKKSWTRSVLNRHKNMKLEDEAMQEALQEFYEGEGDDA